MPNTGSSTLTTGAVATTSPAQQGVHDCGTCASAGPCWQSALPVYDSAEERTLNASNSSPHLRHIQPTRVKRSRKVCVTALKLPPFQQAPSPPLEAQQQFKGQPHTPLPRLTHPFHTSSLGDSQQHHQQHSTAARMATSPRTVASTAAYLPSAGPLLLGVRLCIGTGQGPRTGKVVDVQNSGKHRILFDEGKCEWINLSSSQWTWQTPRAASAGLTPALSQALRKLGAANLVAEPQPPCAGPEGSVLGPAPATAEAAVGQQLWLWCAASGRWHAGLVVALSQAGTGAHHIVYADGADEWVMLSHEVVVWVAAPTEGQAPLRHICPSLAAGTPTPNGEAAVNWRLGIYWHDDQTFFEGTITKYIASSGKHELAYDDGEEEQVELDGQDVVVWRCRLRDTPRARKGASGSHGGAQEDGAAGQDKNKRQHTSRSARLTSR